jgi:O-antigen/teichoic acid export membrane protein
MLISTICGLGMHEIYAKKFVSQPDKKANNFWKGIFWGGNLIFFSSVSFYIFNKYIISLLFDEFTIHIALFLSSLNLLYLNYSITDLLMEDKPKSYIILQLSRSLPFIFLILVFYSADILTYSNILNLIMVYSFMSLFFQFRYFYKKYNFPKLKSLLDASYLRQALSFSLYAVASALLVHADRFFIKYFLGDSDVAIYSVAFLVSSSISMLFVSVGQYTGPKTYKLLNNGSVESIKEAREIFFKLCLAIIVVSLFLGLITPFVIRLITTEEYVKSAEISPLLVLSTMIGTLNIFVSGFLKYLEKTSVLSLVQFSTLLVNVLCNIVLLPRCGVAGSAYSAAISFLFSLLYSSVLVKRYFPQLFARD